LRNSSHCAIACGCEITSWTSSIAVPGSASRQWSTRTIVSPTRWRPCRRKRSYVSLMLPAWELSIGTSPHWTRPTSTASKTVLIDGSGWGPAPGGRAPGRPPPSRRRPPPDTQRRSCSQLAQRARRQVAENARPGRREQVVSQTGAHLYACVRDLLLPPPRGLRAGALVGRAEEEQGLCTDRRHSSLVP